MIWLIICFILYCVEAQEIFRIGLVASLSGRFDRYRGSAYGLLLAEKMINGQFEEGVQIQDSLGRSRRVLVRIELMDDRSLASRHEALLQALLIRSENPVHAIVGGSPAFASIDARLSAEYGRVLIHPHGVSHVVTSAASTGLQIATAPTPARAAAPGIAAFAAAGARNIGIVFAGNDPLSAHCAAGARAIAERLSLRVDVYAGYVAGRNAQSDWGWARSWQSKQATGLPLAPISGYSTEKTLLAAEGDASVPLGYFPTDTYRINLAATEIQEKQVPYLVQCGFQEDMTHLMNKLAEVGHPLEGAFAHPAPLAKSTLDQIRPDYSQLVLTSQEWGPAAAVQDDPLLGSTAEFLAFAKSLLDSATATPELLEDNRMIATLQLDSSVQLQGEEDDRGFPEPSSPEVIATRDGFGPLGATESGLAVQGAAAVSALVQAWQRALQKCKTSYLDVSTAWMANSPTGVEAWECESSGTSVDSLARELGQAALCNATYGVAWGPGAPVRSQALNSSTVFPTAGTSAAVLQRHQLELAAFLCGLPPAEAVAFEPGAASRAINEPRVIKVRTPVMEILQEFRAPSYPATKLEAAEAATDERGVTSAIWDPIRTVAGNIVLDGSVQNAAVDHVLMQALVTKSKSGRGFLDTRPPPGDVPSVPEREVRDLQRTKYSLQLFPAGPMRDGWTSELQRTQSIVLPYPKSGVLQGSDEWATLTQIASTAVFLAIVALGSVLILVRDMDAMKTMPLQVWAPILLGLSLLSIWPSLFVGQPSNQRCHARQWLRGLGTVAVLAPMLAVAMHHRAVADAPTRYQLAFPSVSYVAVWLGAGVALEVVFLAIQSGGAAVELYRGQCGWVHPSSAFVWWMLAGIDVSMLVAVLVASRSVLWAPSPKRVVRRIHQVSIGLLVLASIAVFLAILRAYNGWKGGLATEALLRLLAAPGLVLFVAYRLLEPYLWEAFEERGRRVMDKNGEALDAPPNIRPPNLKGLVVPDPDAAPSSGESADGPRVSFDATSQSQSRSSEEADMPLESIHLSRRFQEANPVAAVLRSDVEQRELAARGASSNTELLHDTAAIPVRRTGEQAVGAGSTGLNLRARYEATLEQQIKQKNAQVSRLQETIVALRGALHMAKERSVMEHDERLLLESRPSRAHSMTPLTHQAADIALARARQRHRRLSMNDYGNHSPSSRPASRSALGPSTTAGDLQIAGVRPGSHGSARVPTPLQELASRFARAQKLLLPGPASKTNENDMLPSQDLGSESPSPTVSRAASPLAPALVRSDISGRRSVEAKRSRTERIGNTGKAVVISVPQDTTGKTQRAGARRSAGETWRLEAIDKAAGCALDARQQATAALGPDSVADAVRHRSSDDAATADAAKEVLPASFASLEASVAFARIRSEVAQDGTDGRLVGPIAEASAAVHPLGVSNTGSTTTTVGGSGPPRRVTLLYDSEEELQEDRNDRVSEAVRLRRQKLRAKWRGKGTGILGASIQRQAQRAQRQASQAAVKQLAGIEKTLGVDMFAKPHEQKADGVSAGARLVANTGGAPVSAGALRAMGAVTRGSTYL